jgi:hypothetical protein
MSEQGSALTQWERGRQSSLSPSSGNCKKIRTVSKEYQNNDYVPAWYQRRFVPVGQRDQELYYLDFKPGFFVDPRGVAHARRAFRKLGFKYCFAEKDLYTTRFGVEESKNIEKHFFGQIDNTGCRVVDLIGNSSRDCSGLTS